MKEKWIFVEKHCYFWGKQFWVHVLPGFSIGYTNRHIHIEFECLFWGITISIRTYKYK